MARIGPAIITLRGEDAGLTATATRGSAAFRRMERDAKRLDREFKQVSASALTFVRNFGSIRTVSTALLGAGGLGYLVKNTAELGATLVETAQSTGLTVSQLQRLQYVFEADGVEATQANRAFQRFNRSIAEAADGVAQYADSFDRIGVSVVGADGQIRGAYDVLLDVADGLAGLSSQAERTAVAMDLFERAGANFLTPLQKGRASVEATIADMGRLGEVTPEAAQNLKDLLQAIADITLALRNRFAQALGENAKQIEEWLQQAVEKVPAALDRVVEVVKAIVENMELLVGVWATAFAANTIASIFSAAKALRTLARAAKAATAANGLILLSSYMGTASAAAASLAAKAGVGGKAIAAAGAGAAASAVGFLAVGEALAGGDKKSILGALQTLQGGILSEPFKAFEETVDTTVGKARDRVTDFSAAWRDFDKQYQDFVNRDLDVDVGESSFRFTGLRVPLESVKDSVSTLYKAFQHASQEIGEDLSPLELAPLQVPVELQLPPDLIRSIREETESIARQASDAARLASVSDDVAVSERARLDVVRQIDTAYLSVNTRVLEIYRSLQIASEAGENFRVENLLKDLEAADAQVKQIAAIRADSGLLESLVAGREDALQKQEREVKNSQRLTEEARRRAALERQAARTFARGLEDALVGARKIQDVFREIIREIALAALRQALINPLADALGSAISSALPKFGGGKASGGPVAGGTAYLVGEKGPELFVPRSAGTIIANGGGGGGGLTLNLNVQGADESMVRRTLAEFLPGILRQAEQISTSAVNRSRLRPTAGVAA